MSNLILCGYQNCGKTTIGRQLAEALQRPFIDTDALIAPDHRLFTRQREREVIAQLAPTQPCVISLGGGPLCHLPSARKIKRLGTLIYLYLPPEVLEERMERQPFFQVGDFTAFWHHRHAIYQTFADITLDIQSEGDVLSALCRQIALDLP